MERIGGGADENEWEDCNANKGDAKQQKEEAESIEKEEEKVAGEALKTQPKPSQHSHHGGRRALRSNKPHGYNKGCRSGAQRRNQRITH